MTGGTIRALAGLATPTLMNADALVSGSHQTFRVIGSRGRYENVDVSLVGRAEPMPPPSKRPDDRHHHRAGRTSHPDRRA